MDDPEALEPAEVVLHRAREAGFTVSAAELARWHRAGLVPLPHQQSLGKGKGTRSLYPAGTACQVIALCQIHTTLRSLNDVGWFLWWHGFAVAERFWRERLSSEAIKWDRAIEQMKKYSKRLDSEDDEVADQADRELIRARDARTNLKLVRRIRKRVGKEEFPSVLRLIIGLAAGDFENGPAMAVEDHVIDKTLGLDAARQHHLPGMAPWLEGSVRPELGELSELLASNRATVIFGRMSDNELNQAREEVRDLLRGLEIFSRGMRQTLGKNPFGFGIIREISEAARPIDLAQLVLGWGLLKRMWPVFRRNYPPILIALRNVISISQANRA